MELRRLVVYDLRYHATCREAEGAVSSSAKRHLSRQHLEALGATPRGSWSTA